MSRPSEPLLRWLRELLRERKVTSAALAESAKLPHAHVRKLLAGGEPMTVDELLQLTQALDLSPKDFGMMAGFELAAVEPEDEAIPPAVDETAFVAGIDPYGNHPKQLFQVGFTLGCDFWFHADPSLLGDSKVPKDVLSRFPAPRLLPIQLDAAYHQYNNPRYTESGITLTLSFDALYDCTFAWEAIKQFAFFPIKPELIEDEPEEEPTPAPKRSHLRLVE